MQPRIEILPEKKLLGKHLKMTIASDRTKELWQSFISVRKIIKNNITSELFNLQVFDNSFDYKDFNLTTEFEKWAAVEVYDFDDIPKGMETLILKGGLYAVFIYKGLPSDYHHTWQYIFNKWLPASEYEVDNRIHFEILGDKYKNNDPESEEEVWIPVKRKK